MQFNNIPYDVLLIIKSYINYREYEIICNMGGDSEYSFFDDTSSFLLEAKRVSTRFYILNGELIIRGATSTNLRVVD